MTSSQNSYQSLLIERESKQILTRKEGLRQHKTNKDKFFQAPTSAIPETQLPLSSTTRQGVRWSLYSNILKRNNTNSRFAEENRIQNTSEKATPSNDILLQRLPQRNVQRNHTFQNIS